MYNSHTMATLAIKKMSKSYSLRKRIKDKEYNFPLMYYFKVYLQ